MTQPERSSAAAIAPDTTTTPPAAEPEGGVDTSTTAQPHHQPPSPTPPAPARASLTIIEVDTTPVPAPDNGALDADDTAEPLLPMLSTRTGLSHERAQRLFEKYGIKYEPRQTGNESDQVRDIRRVEKPIRVRIHYTCEECNTSFGASRTCSNCGHRRCRDCPRNPARRVREVLHEAREQAQQARQHAAMEQQQQTQEVPMAITPVEPNDDATDGATEERLLAAQQEGTSSRPTTDMNQYQYVVHQRPTSGVQLVLRPRAQIVRRTCHECQTHFEPANRTTCQNCSHQRCTLCPSERLTEETTMEGEQQQAAFVPNMVATVQRVYKKPRQRVRWTCDQCQSLFADRERCRECGHLRCDECIRSP